MIWVKSRKILALLLLIALGMAALAQGHDPGLSAVEARFEGEHLAVALTLARSDLEALVPLDTDRDGKISVEEMTRARPALDRLARRAFEVQTDGAWPALKGIKLWLDEGQSFHFSLSYSRPAGSLLRVRSILLADLPFGHRQYFSLLDPRKRIVAERILSAQDNRFDIDLTQIHGPGAESFTARQFILLGIEHILTGYDHLAFLLALLLAGGALVSAAKIISSFTLAHSITLALATLDVAHVPSRLVEPLIAASILYVGLENIFRGDLKRRWLLTFAFGLIHGFGFATALREMGIGSSGGGVVIPLLSFNLGVELGQIAIAATVLPLIWKLRERPSFAARFAPACSVLVALAGGYWLVTRLFF